MLPTEPPAQDFWMQFWGVYAPTWLAAVGTVAASVVAVVALVSGRSANAGVREIVDASSDATPSVSEPRDEPQASASTATPDPPELQYLRLADTSSSWSLHRTGRHLRVTNTSSEMLVLYAVVARSVAITVTVDTVLPQQIWPGMSVTASVDTGSMFVPSAIGFRVRWQTSSGAADSASYLA